MSKNDTIGAVACAMAGMNPKFVGLVSDVANRLNQQGPEAAAWYVHITNAIQQGLPKSPALKAKHTAHSSVEVVNGVTHVIVTSDGRTDEDFIRMWEEKYCPTKMAKDITHRARLTPTTGTTYRIPIIMGSDFSDENRATSKIREEAARRHYLTLPFEAACLLREAVSDEDLKRMGLFWLGGMHHPVLDSGRNPRLLGVRRNDDSRRVDACRGHSGDRWRREAGFAFLASQV